MTPKDGRWRGGGAWRCMDLIYRATIQIKDPSPPACAGLGYIYVCVCVSVCVCLFQQLQRVNSPRSHDSHHFTCSLAVTIVTAAIETVSEELGVFLLILFLSVS